MGSLVFGDLVENGAASIDNPQRYGYFVRRGYRDGKLNPGPFVEMTDARGKFWTCKGDLLVKIGAKTLAPLPSHDGKTP